MSSGWNFIHFLRLAVAFVFGMQAIQNHDALSGFIAVLFLLQALTNTDCYGSATCAPNNNHNQKNTIQDDEFEEVK
jgi:hypothetical protein